MSASILPFSPRPSAIEEQIMVPHNLYALREARFDAVRKTIALKNPGLPWQETEIQAELFITEAWHRAADESLKWRRRFWTGVTLINGLGLVKSGTDSFHSIIVNNPDWVTIGISIAQSLGIGASLIGNFAHSHNAKYIRQQGDMESGYSYDEYAYGDKKIYQKALRTIDGFINSEKKNIAIFPAPAG